MSGTVDVSPLDAFQWKRQPEAAALVRSLVDRFLQTSPAGRVFADRMQREAGTRFLDWVDTIFLTDGEAMVGRLEAVGYERARDVEGHVRAWRQPHGVFPRVVLHDADTTRVLLKVDSVTTFLATNDLRARIDGEPGGPMRVAIFAQEGETQLGVVERHGYRGYEPPRVGAERIVMAAKALDAFRLRRRDFDTDEEGYEHAHDLADAYIRVLGRDWVCDLWFEAERQYWMKRNRAAQVQYARQQRLGMGWANHDHHTYRSSRRMFPRLVAFWEGLGFTCRERYHAGIEAGWGAQVMEHEATGITTFNDVDLSPEELFNDFAHEPIEERQSLGTVGLWCALHGEAFLQAGMHHLECMFDFESLRDQLATEAGIETMKPFTDFPYLRQAFTKGERWPVNEERIRRLLETEAISQAQAEQFRAQGAIGSHLENLERNEGFKGFNQKGVSEIISATDPRKQGKQVV